MAESRLPATSPIHDDDVPESVGSTRAQRQPSDLTLTGERTLPGIAHENYLVKIDLFTGVRPPP